MNISLPMPIHFLVTWASSCSPARKRKSQPVHLPLRWQIGWSLASRTWNAPPIEKSFCLKPPIRVPLSSPSRTSTLERKIEMPRRTCRIGLAAGRADFDIERRESLVVGEPQQLREDAEAVLAAMQDLLVGLGVVDVEVVGGLEDAEVLFDEKQIAVQDGVHGGSCRR